MSRASNGRGSVYRSKDTTGWEGLVSFGKDPVTGRRLRKKVRGRTKNEVQAKVDQLTLLRRNVRGPVDFRLTFSEFLHRWVDAKVGSVAPSTTSGYRTDLLYVDESGVGAVRLVDLGEADIEELYRWVVSTGRSRGTVAHLKRTINTALVKAVKRGQLAVNPVPEVEVRGDTQDSPEPYDLDEIDMLIDTIRGLPYGIRWQLALLGMRRSEVLGLRWQNINLNRGVLKVRNSLVWSDMQHGCLTRDSEPTCGKSRARYCPDVIASEPSFGPLKTAKSKRDITLPDQLIEDLRVHKAAQDAQRAAAGAAWQDYDCVIADSLGVPSRLDFDRSEWVHVAYIAT